MCVWQVLGEEPSQPRAPPSRAHDDRQSIRAFARRLDLDQRRHRSRSRQRKAPAFASALASCGSSRFLGLDVAKRFVRGRARGRGLLHDARRGRGRMRAFRLHWSRRQVGAGRRVLSGRPLPADRPVPRLWLGGGRPRRGVVLGTSEPLAPGRRVRGALRRRFGQLGRWPRVGVRQPRTGARLLPWLPAGPARVQVALRATPGVASTRAVRRRLTDRCDGNLQRRKRLARRRRDQHHWRVVRPHDGSDQSTRPGTQSDLLHARRDDRRRAHVPQVCSDWGRRTQRRAHSAAPRRRRRRRGVQHGGAGALRLHERLPNRLLLLLVDGRFLHPGGETLPLPGLRRRARVW